MQEVLRSEKKEKERKMRFNKFLLTIYEYEAENYFN